MRVAFLAGHLSRRASGVRQMIEGLSGAVERRGVEACVFGIRDENWARDASGWRGGPAQVLDRLGPGNFGYVPELQRALEAYDPDLIHLHGIWMYSSAIAGAWAKRSGRPLVVAPHGMLAPAALAYSPTRKRLARVAFQDRCFAHAAGYHATSEAEASDIRRYLGGVDVAVVPNGVSAPEVACPDWKDRAHKVLALGRLHPIKGLDRLLQAWARVEADFPRWSLEIAGPDPEGYGAVLRELVAALDLKRASFSGPRFGAERDALIAGARLFALPSLSENFALTVPEALVCQTPVLASDQTPWKELQEMGCGWCVAPQVEAISQGLRAAMEMPDDALAGMGRRGKDWAEEAFGWDGIASDLIDFYDRIGRAG